MAGPARKFDLNELAHRTENLVELQVKSPEPTEELLSRLRREEEDARHERTKALIGYLAALVGLGTVCGFCLWIAIGSHSSADDKKWATAILTSIVSLWGGYVAGKSQVAK